MKRPLGLVFMIFGVLGLVMSVLMLPAVLYGRSIASEQVTLLADGVNAPLVRAETATTSAEADLATLSGRVQQIADQAEQAAQSGQLDRAVADRLIAAVDDTLQTEFPRLREALITGRERMTSALENHRRMQRLFGFLPFSPFGDDELGPIATELAQLEANLRQTRANLAAAAPASAVAQQLATGLRQLDARIQMLSTRIDAIGARFDQAQASVNEAAGTLHTVINLGTLALVLLFLYIALLHTVLFATGRALWRGEVWTAPAPRPAADVARPAQAG